MGNIVPFAKICVQAIHCPDFFKGRHQITPECFIAGFHKPVRIQLGLQTGRFDFILGKEQSQPNKRNTDRRNRDYLGVNTDKKQPYTSIHDIHISTDFRQEGRILQVSQFMGQYCLQFAIIQASDQIRPDHNGFLREKRHGVKQARLCDHNGTVTPCPDRCAGRIKFPAAIFRQQTFVHWQTEERQKFGPHQ